MGGIIRCEVPHRFHLDDERRIAFISLVNRPLQATEVLEAPFRRCVWKTAYAVMLERNALDLHEDLPLSVLYVEIESRVAVRVFWMDLRVITEKAGFGDELLEGPIRGLRVYVYEHIPFVSSDQIIPGLSFGILRVKEHDGDTWPQDLLASARVLDVYGLFLTVHLHLCDESVGTADESSRDHTFVSHKRNTR